MNETMSGGEHLTSDILHRTSDIRCPMCDV